MNVFEKQESSIINSLNTGDIVLYISLNNSDNNSLFGLWKKGKVVKVLSESDSIQLEDITSSKTVLNNNNNYSSFVLPLKITFIAPIPITKNTRNDNNNNSNSNSISELNGDDIEGIISLPSYHSNNNYNNMYETSSIYKSNDQIGSWEKHTKGFGSLLLFRRYYKKNYFLSISSFYNILLLVFL